MNERDVFKECFGKVLRFFDFNIHKTLLWFESENPMLGGISPRNMIQAGRIFKLHEFIISSLAENEPLENDTL